MQYFNNLFKAPFRGQICGISSGDGLCRSLERPAIPNPPERVQPIVELQINRAASFPAVKLLSLPVPPPFTGKAVSPEFPHQVSACFAALGFPTPETVNHQQLN